MKDKRKFRSVISEHLHLDLNEHIISSNDGFALLIDFAVKFLEAAITQCLPCLLLE